jgi:hypothetical protein
MTSWDVSARLRRGRKNPSVRISILNFRMPLKSTADFKDREALEMRVDAIDVSLRQIGDKRPARLGGRGKTQVALAKVAGGAGPKPLQNSPMVVSDIGADLPICLDTTVVNRKSRQL